MPGKSEPVSQSPKLKIIPENGVLRSASSSPSPSPRISVNNNHNNNNHNNNLSHHHIHPSNQPQPQLTAIRQTKTSTGEQQQQQRRLNDYHNQSSSPSESIVLSGSRSVSQLARTSIRDHRTQRSSHHEQSADRDYHNHHNRHHHHPNYHNPTRRLKRNGRSDSTTFGIVSLPSAGHDFLPLPSIYSTNQQLAFNKPSFPVMGSKTPRQPTICSSSSSRSSSSRLQRHASANFDEGYGGGGRSHFGVFDSPMTRSAIELDAFGSVSNDDYFRSTIHSRRGYEPHYNASPQTAPSRKTIWIPSPHVITTDNHHSRHSFCACCHGVNAGSGRNDYVFGNDRGGADNYPFEWRLDDAEASEFHDSSAPPYAARSMPRMKPKWKRSPCASGVDGECNADDSSSAPDRGYGYSSQTLPLNPRRTSKNNAFQKGECGDGGRVRDVNRLQLESNAVFLFFGFFFGFFF